MKTCPYCKIEVGGNPKKCPLCQSKLAGEGCDPYFPRQTMLRRKSFLYKLQLFIVWAIVIAGLGLDFLFDLRITAYPSVRWSLLLAMWLISFEFLMMRQFRKGTGSARKVTMMVFIMLVLLGITAYFFGLWQFVLDWIAPCTIAATMVANFVLAMIDKKGTAMAYLLTILLTGVVSYIVLRLSHKEMPATWIICLLVGVILFVGAIIFKGRSVADEIQRRLSV